MKILRSVRKAYGCVGGKQAFTLLAPRSDAGQLSMGAYFCPHPTLNLCPSYVLVSSLQHPVCCSSSSSRPLVAFQDEHNQACISNFNSCLLSAILTRDGPTEAAVDSSSCRSKPKVVLPQFADPGESLTKDNEAADTAAHSIGEIPN